MALEMDALPGTYALILQVNCQQTVQIGRLGRLAVEPGYYVYVGSALGPGGVRARVGHHARITQRPHWHIDYLRRAAALRHVWYAYGSVRREHAWADIFARLPGASIPLSGFGASDCTCPAHLFFFDRTPLLWTFRNTIATSAVGEYLVHIASVVPLRPGKRNDQELSSQTNQSTQ